MSVQKEINNKTQSSDYSTLRRNFLKIGGASLLAGGLTNVQNADAFNLLSEISAKASGLKGERYWNFIRAQFPLV